MLQGFTGLHALIILVVILLLFGAPKLPALARSLGQSMKILKNEVRSDGGDDAAAEGEPGAEAGTGSKKLANGSASATDAKKPGGEPGSNA
ncbi:twin-arginine translocase TatA/TatE family subunit [Agromyces archimandritae]|uniref:Sec-independent protein translocase protein TatA n=1 Tax=Agromyces archimandritae TaxID=2781962 RepID=A0A975FMC3_9MICO|nr:twin-arginine translocase TatA/TatE family subunit [Agromyces archimandritae]QTX04764.1 twin-arginine translocase TatA/TatE family subunit [Agromyces archimandritae]